MNDVLSRSTFEVSGAESIKPLELPARVIIEAEKEPDEVLSRSSFTILNPVQSSKDVLPNGYIKLETTLFNGDGVVIETIGDKTVANIGKKQNILFPGVLSVEKAIKTIHRDGSLDLKYVIKYASQMGNVHFPIESTKYRKELLTTLESKFPAFGLNKFLPNYAALFDTLAQAIVAKNDFLTDVEYDFHGWAKNTLDPGWTYLNGSMINVKSDMKLPVANAKDFAWGLENLMNLANGDPRLYLIFLFSHMGFMALIFHRAGVDPHFIVNVTGPSGSFKTSLLKVLSGGIFEGDGSCECRFTDTPASINAMILRRVNSLLLFDDNHPTTSKGNKSLMKGNLGLISRAFGDGESVGKLGPDRKTFLKEKIIGAAWMTSEMLDFSAFSDILRVVNVAINNDTINVNALTILQDNIGGIRRYFSFFVDSLGKKFTDVEQWIRSSRHSNRQTWREFLQIGAGRYADAALVLAYINDIVWKIACENNIPDAETKRLNGVSMLSSFFKQLVTAADDWKPTAVFVNCFKEFFHNSRLLLASDKASYLAGVGEGYLDESNLILNTVYANKVFQRYCEEHNLSVVALERQELIDAGIIVAGRDRATTVRKGNKRPPVYAFKNSVLGIETNAENDEGRDK